MTSRSRTAGGLLARLLLLGVLLIGLGVVHTLAHADAHDGVTGHTTVGYLDLGPTDPASPGGSDRHAADTFVEALHHAATLAAADPDSLPEADCWASAPTGPWPVPSAQLATGTVTPTDAAPPTRELHSCRAHTSPLALGVLRI
ncbi:hypothetical protein AB0I00_18920 [Streptomyces sp. NPDC050803]|uniref:hypothetical protein n=1 Tax=unclassified Streptomyces TaxID=2593676 RepID=UPI0034436EB5